VDTYYRRCSSASYVGNVSVPLLCINALDYPLCTREAIPWDHGMNAGDFFLVKLMVLVSEKFCLCSNL
jgi:predicted alpha/beta-fold hydrolase